MRNCVRSSCLTQAIGGVGLAALLCSAARAADWNQWLGPNRNGVTSEDSGWSAGGWPPPELWEKNVGRGCTSPILISGRVYVMGWQGSYSSGGAPVGMDEVVCLDANDGTELWKQTYSCRLRGREKTGDESYYGGPSATPTYDPANGYLYTLSIDGDLRCWDTNNSGQVVWGRNFYDDYSVNQRAFAGGGVRDYGYSSSPLISGSLVVVEVGDDEGNLMAFNKTTGTRVWASADSTDAGHTSGPVPITVQGVPCIATLTLTRLLVVRADSGNEGNTVATYSFQTNWANNIPTPAVAGDQILLSSAKDYNLKKSVLLDVSLSGASKAWESSTSSGVSSPVVASGYGYMVHDRLLCIDMANGSQVWSGGSTGGSSQGSCLVTGDGRVIVWGNNRLALVEGATTSSTYQELNLVTGVLSGASTCFPSVALAEGKILCKDKVGNLAVRSVGTAAPPNQPPVANDDSDQTAAGAPVTINVVTNDTDPDLDALTVQSVTQPSNGSVTNNGNGTVTYTPSGGFSGTDEFNYTVVDGNGGSDTALVTVLVTGAPDTSAPVTALRSLVLVGRVNDLGATLTVNGQSVALDAVGGFSKEVTIGSSAQTITMTATDALGTSRTRPLNVTP